MRWVHLVNFRFCFACIDNWSTITNLCPLCQNEFQLITCVPVSDVKFRYISYGKLFLERYIEICETWYPTAYTFLFDYEGI